MSSNINPYNIDGSFPVAGQDNSSQGFRDNFTNIKNNFAFAQNEINDLQSKAILKSALSDGTTISNDMAGTQLTRPQLNAWTQSYLDVGLITEGKIFNFNDGNFQKITTGGAITINFSNWPSIYGAGALGYGSMRIWISVTDVSHTVTLPESVSIGVNDIAGYDPVTRTIQFDAPGDYVFDISSLNGGVNYLITDVNCNRSTQAGGIVITGYQYADPSDDFVDNIKLNVSRYIIDPTNTITNGNLRLPDVVLDGTTISISSTETITNLSVWAGPNVAVKPNATITLNAGTSIEYFYRASETKWYKTR